MALSKPKCCGWLLRTRTCSPALALAAQGLRAQHGTRHAAPSSERRYSSRTPQDIAVLGGGLTGLTTAYYLTRFLPSANITLYEGNNRLGGWVDTEKVEVKTKSGGVGYTFFERGARTIAPSRGSAYDDMVLYQLIDELDLYKEAWTTDRTKSTPLRRYVYYPDHLVAVDPPKIGLDDPLGSVFRGAGYLSTVLQEPVFQKIIPFAWEYMNRLSDPLHNVKQQRHVAEVTSESLGSFFQRMGGYSEPVNNLLSAIVHGIYGGDIWQWDASSSHFTRSWMDKVQFTPPGTTHVFMPDLHMFHDLLSRGSTQFRTIAQHSVKWSSVNFLSGFSTLPNAIIRELNQNRRVTVRLDEPVTKVTYDDRSGKAKIITRGSTTIKTHDKVVCSLTSKALDKITGGRLPIFGQSAKAISIQVVNLFYPKENLHAPYRGFGYLIPSSIPFEQNPEAALGVLFDSDREAQSPLDEEHPRIPGSKYTVMLGGHLLDFLPPDQWPTEQEAIAAAKRVLSRHLGIPESEPCIASAKLCRDCIPQHHVPHRANMAAAHDQLMAAYRGTLAVVGSSYTLPGVLPGLRAARDLAMDIAGEHYRVKADAGVLVGVGPTGLERFHGDPNDRWFPIMKEQLPLRFGNSLSPEKYPIKVE